MLAGTEVTDREILTVICINAGGIRETDIAWMSGKLYTHCSLYINLMIKKIIIKLKQHSYLITTFSVYSKL